MKCSGRITRNHIRITLPGTVVGIFLFVGLPAGAGIQGVCYNCRTIHNSQSNLPWTFYNSSPPNNCLLKGACLSFHAQGGTQAMVALGADTLPQVYHNEATDQAAGNFANIIWDKG